MTLTCLCVLKLVIRASISYSTDTCKQIIDLVEGRVEIHYYNKLTIFKSQFISPF